MKNGLVLKNGLMVLVLLCLTTIAKGQSKGEWRLKLETEATVAVLNLASAAEVQSGCLSTMGFNSRLRQQCADRIGLGLGGTYQQYQQLSRLLAVNAAIEKSQGDLTEIREGVWKDANDTYDQGCFAHAQFQALDMEMMWRPMAESASKKYKESCIKFNAAEAKFYLLRLQVNGDLGVLQTLWCDVAP